MKTKNSKTIISMLAFGLGLIAAAATAQEEFDLDQVVETCVSCHGEDGIPIETNYPIIQGQQFFYIYTQLKDIKAGRRAVAEMEGIVADFSRDQLKQIADHFAKLPWPGIEAPHVTDEDRALARQATVKGQCGACHGKWFGDSRIPRLAGQLPDYLIKTMLDYKNDIRQNAPDKSSTMSKLSEAEVEALSRYLAGLF